MVLLINTILYSYVLAVDVIKQIEEVKLFSSCNFRLLYWIGSQSVSQKASIFFLTATVDKYARGSLYKGYSLIFRHF